MQFATVDGAIVGGASSVGLRYVRAGPGGRPDDPRAATGRGDEHAQGQDPDESAHCAACIHASRRGKELEGSGPWPLAQWSVPVPLLP